MTEVANNPESRLYEDVAGRVCKLIESGTLRPGQRIPSIRKLTKQFGVSVSTVLQAYRLLEDRGHITAKPQSGYYVRNRFWQQSPEPEISQPPCESTSVCIADLAERVLLEGRRTDLVKLAAAISGNDALPIRRLNRISAAVARRSPGLAATYCVPPGDPQLCVQVARRAMEAGVTLSPEQIIVTSGAQEALGFCLRAVTRPGDAVAIESPTFYGILQLIDVLGLRAVEIPTRPQTGICLDGLAEAITANADGSHPIRACLFVNNFNNPLGSCMPDDQKERLVAMLAEREIPLIEDDIYGELGFAPQRPKSCKAFDTQGNVMLCSSFSKTLAPGYRVGWCAPGKWYDHVRRLKLFTNVATATLPQRAIAEFLSTGGYDHHLRRLRKHNQENIVRMSGAVAEHFPEGTRMTRPQGGFVLWVEMDERVDSLELRERALQRGIAIAPGPIFSASGKFRNCIRVDCECWSPEIESAIETLGKLVAAMR